MWGKPLKYAIGPAGNPETKCLLIGFHEEQSKASLIGAVILARGVSRCRKVQMVNLWLFSRDVTAAMLVHLNN